MVTARAALLLVFAMGLLHSAPAAGNSGGITDRSGQGRLTCNQCHDGGQRPHVEFIGPAQVQVGDTAAYRFTVQSSTPGAGGAGFNVAADAGVFTAVPGQVTRVRNGELTHNEPREYDAQRTAGWDFLWTAPLAPGAYKLFRAGNAVNLNRQTSGDRTDTAVFEVQVVTAADTATPTASPTATLAVPSPTASPSATDTAAPTASPSPAPPSVSPTATATSSDSATPTASATSVASTSPDLVCPGDCSDDREVSISDLIRAVSIALGALPLGACPTVDTNVDGIVSIAELIGAVNNALNAC